MKRIASTLLLFLFLFNIVGYYALFVVLNFENKAEIAIRVEDEKYLETIRIHKSEVKNIVFKERGKEFLYNGEMYDIKDKSFDGDYIIFHCINDKKEKMLLANLDNHIQNNINTKSASGEKKNDISKNILKDYFLTMKGISFFLSSKNVIFKSSNPLFCTFIISLSSPPPKISFS